MESKKYPLKLILRKSGEMIYFSQLDLVRILERALRRSRLPLFYSQGFNPRVKMSFFGGLKLGLEGNISLTFYFTEVIIPIEKYMFNFLFVKYLMKIP